VRGVTSSPLIPARDLIDWLNRQELLSRSIRIESVKAHIRFMQVQGDEYHSQFNPAV